MARNYYLILGVPWNASSEEIHDAYRRLAKANHPDVSGTDSGERFREVQEAWETLGDAERRQAYDRGLKRAQRTTSSPTASGGHGWGYSKPAVSDSLEEFDMPLGGTYVFTPGGQEIHFGLQMTRAEAATGGVIPLRVPLQIRCPRCAGSGSSLFFICPLCEGTGSCSRWRTIQFRVPAGLRNHSALTVPLAPLGLPRARLILHVEITHG
jgi:molecular chaperone DnaJ